MGEPVVRAEIDDRGVATVRLNRPEVNNAYDGEMIRSLIAAFEALGLEELALGHPGAVTVVEWAERWNEPPVDALRLRLERPEGAIEGRHLVVVAEASWARGWPEDVPRNL